MKHYTRILLVICLTSVIATPLYALHVKGLYQASVPMITQSDLEKVRAEQQAYALVLAKVTGDGNIMAEPGLAAAANKASEFVQEFGYSPNDSIIQPYLLRVKFDPKEINRLLHQNDILVWRENRPLLMTWAEYEEPNVPAVIISKDVKMDIQHLLVHQAEKIGLPLILPMMDVADMDSIDVNDIVTMQMSKLSDAANRYETDGILAIRIFKLQKGYSIQAKLSLDNFEKDWNMSGSTKEEIVSNLLNHVAEVIVERANGVY